MPHVDEFGIGNAVTNLKVGPKIAEVYSSHAAILGEYSEENLGKYLRLKPDPTA